MSYQSQSPLELCLKHLNMLEEAGLVKMEDGFTLQPTETGRLMARYYVAFDSMNKFLGFNGKEDLATLVSHQFIMSIIYPSQSKHNVFCNYNVKIM